MRNLKSQLCQFAVMLAIFAVAFGNLVPLAMAADQPLTAKADSVTIMPDVNGNTYVRIIITEKRSLNGVSYDKSIPVMFFGKPPRFVFKCYVEDKMLVDKAKGIKEGDTFKAIVTPREYQGRESYTALSLL